MIPEWISRVFTPILGRRKGTSLSSLAPDERFYFIGDIHGRLDLLQALLPALDEECPIIFAGDYIDRGAYSAQVLRHLHHLSASSSRQVVCLKGNHEEMLLAFLDNPQSEIELWRRNGGVHTLMSFGLGFEDASDGAPEIVASQLRAAMGQSLLAWLKARPLTWISGNVVAVHAALDPSEPVNAQLSQVCLWGHPRFRVKQRKDGHWVVHGHTIVPYPQILNRVISADTGAIVTGCLTAVEISPGQIRFVSTSKNGIIRSNV